MRQAPVRDVAVTWGAPCQWQSDAGKVVFSGDTVHAFAGFGDALPDTASVAWTEGCGTVRQEAMQLDGQLVEGDTLGRVAAAFRIGASTARERHALALRYGLVTATTSMLVVNERVDMERACKPPILRVVPQMHAAGHGGIGGLRVAQSPAVWRREIASEQIQAMMRNGVETYETPAFLRGQEHASRYLYRGQLRQFLQLQDAVLRGGKGPLTLAEVEDLLPDAVLRQLQDIAEQGHTPDEVLRQFILALHRCFRRRFLPLRLFDRIRRRDRAGTRMDPLQQRVSLVAAEVYNAAHPRVEDIPAFLRKRAD